MGVWQLIAEDIRAWKRHGFGRDDGKVRLGEALGMYFRYMGLRATVLYRFSRAVRRLHIPGMSLMLWHRGIRRYGLDIVPSVAIGPGLYIAHPVGTVIMAHQIGSNLSITTSVTIGMRTVPQFPTIGDNVTIGAGARVLGAITLGDGVIVGANAVVLDDVPAGATAVGVPARVLLAKGTLQLDYSSTANGANSL
jgi:serine O-acetyltransferase